MSERLSAWEIEHLSAQGEPDTSWALELPKLFDPPFLFIYEHIPTDAPQEAVAHWCYAATAQFYRSGYVYSNGVRRHDFHNYAQVDMPPRTWPSTHFAFFNAEYFEVCGGSIIWDRDLRSHYPQSDWYIRWRAARNTTHARHLNGKHLGNENCSMCSVYSRKDWKVPA